MNTPPARQGFAFGPFRLVPAQRLLLDGDRPVRLGSRAMAILVALVERAGEVLSKEALVAKVWPGGVVDAAALRVHMAALRKVLGDGRDGQRFVVTVPQRGYSFVAPVTPIREDTSADSADPAGRSSHNLPSSPTRMVGRGDVVDTLAARLAQHRCVTIVGTGGIGKTTAALALAGRLVASYADGARFVDLASITDGSLVPQGLASVLDVAVSLDDPLPSLVDALCGRRMLIVLDNCEHVIDAAASLAETLLLRVPRLDIIATSREALRIRGEWVQRLDSLAIPPRSDAASPALTAAEAMSYPGIQLFAARCAAAVDGFEIVDANAPVAAEICRRLDGIPLAIELAAGRVEEFGLQGVASLLDDLLRPLARGWRNAPPRHRTLRATLEWSHGRLGDDERRVLRRIAVFRGSFTLPSGESVCGERALDGIGGLALKSMLSVDASGDEVHYRLLDTTRAYAMEQLVESGELHDTLRLHAEHCTLLARQMQSEWEQMPAGQWMIRYARRIDDLRAALDWALANGGDVGLGLHLTLASGTLFRQMSLLSEYRTRVQRALECIAAGRIHDPVCELQLNSALAHLLMHTTGITPQVQEAFERANALSQGFDIPACRAKALGGMWLLKIAQADYLGAAEFAASHRDTGAAAMTHGHAYTQAMGFHVMGQHADLRRHASRLLSAPAIHLRLSDVTLQGDTRLATQTVLSRTLWMQGLPDQALRLAAETVELAREDNAVMLGVSLAFGACPVALWSGESTLAQAWISQLLEHTRRHGLMYLHAWGQGYDLLQAVCAAGSEMPDDWSSVIRWPLQLDTMRTMHDTLIDAAAVDRARQGLSPWNAAEVLRRQGELLLSRTTPGGTAQAEALLTRSLDLAREQGALSWELRTSMSLAKLRSRQGRVDLARSLLSKVVSRFTEGHGTADLRDAQALLQQLERPAQSGISKLFNS